MTAAEAVAAAKAALPIVAPAEATVTTRHQADGDVYVVTSPARVRTMSTADDKIYTGYEAVFEVASGRMVTARLGTLGR
jgi:hypothetical protein